jgi:hypothetical protein
MTLKGWDRTRSSHISFRRRRKLRQNSVRGKQTINPRDGEHIVAHFTAIYWVFALLCSLLLHFLFFSFHKNLFYKRRNRTEKRVVLLIIKSQTHGPHFVHPSTVPWKKLSSLCIFQKWTVQQYLWTGNESHESCTLCQFDYQHDLCGTLCISVRSKLGWASTLLFQVSR